MFPIMACPILLSLDMRPKNKTSHPYLLVLAAGASGNPPWGCTPELCVCVCLCETGCPSKWNNFCQFWKSPPFWHICQMTGFLLISPWSNQKGIPGGSPKTVAPPTRTCFPPNQAWFSPPSQTWVPPEPNVVSPQPSVDSDQPWIPHIHKKHKDIKQYKHNLIIKLSNNVDTQLKGIITHKQWHISVYKGPEVRRFNAEAGRRFACCSWWALCRCGLQRSASQLGVRNPGWNPSTVPRLPFFLN